MKRLLLGVTLVLLACQKEPATTDTSTTSTTTAPPAQQEIQYVAINPSVYVPKDTINSWIDATPINTTAIAGHAWDIWAGMTADSGQVLDGTALPVWETWYDSTEVYASGAGSGPQSGASASLAAARVASPKANAKRRFQLPHQFFKHGTFASRKSAGGDSSVAVVLTFNRFTQEFRDHVWGNQYYSSDVLNTLNNGWPTSTPLQNRTIKSFPDKSIMLKPVFITITGTAPTPVPYWNGTGTNATTNPQNPTSETWKQCVLADPTGKATNMQPMVCNKGKAGETTMAAGTYQVMPVSATPSQSSFYAFQLTQDEVDDMKALNPLDQGGEPLAVGDYALFVATHVSSREIDNWTWQTFWWSPNPASLPPSPPTALAPPSNIQKPWNMYVGCTAYYMVTPPSSATGQPLYCFNPYLETDLTGLFNEPKTQKGTGVVSNCMTCHRAAAWPDNDYAQAFLLQPGDPNWFSGNTKTDFTWSMPNLAHQAPFVPPPGK